MVTNTKVKDAVILAGGKGSRLRNKINNYSKSMIPILGKPLITYTIDALLDSGINNIFILFHSSTADVLNLSTYNEVYSNTLKFIEVLEQKGGLLAFYYARNLVNVPFIMTVSDIIVQKKDFQQMLFTGLNLINECPDLLIQTVNNPSIPFEKNLLIKNKTVMKWEKIGIIDPKLKNYKVKSGGMIYLWLKNPFPFIKTFLSNENYNFSHFLQHFIQNHNVLEMPINDLWDIDLPEDIVQTESILQNYASN
jgi:choline kinase